MKTLLNSIILYLLLACGSPSGEQQPKVHHFGALKLMMHQGDIDSKYELTKLKNKANVYALGAMAQLKGEILILNSEVYLSSEGENNGVEISHDLKGGAALLVYAEVQQWEAMDVPDSIHTYGALEKWIEQMAALKGMNTEKPFPFRLNGHVSALDWHVINWPEGDSVHSHDKHVQSGPHGTLTNEAVQILGFFSKHHHAIFTHHSTNMHLHFITEDGKLAGHVDGMVPAKGMQLHLPAFH